MRYRYRSSIIFGTANASPSRSGALVKALSTASDGRTMSSRNTFTAPSTAAVGSIPCVSYSLSFSTCVKIWLSCLANASFSAGDTSSRANFATFSTSSSVIFIAQLFRRMVNMAVILTLPPRRAQKHAFSSKAAGSPAAEAYLLGYIAGRWTTENEAGSHFQHAFSPPTPACSGARLPRLFHRHALGKIPRLIHIRPPQHRNMIGEQLQGNRKQDRRHQGMRIGNGKYGIRRPA